MNIRTDATLPRFSLTPNEAASSTGFSRTRIFQAIRDGQMTAIKDGKSTVIETDELLRWLRSLPKRGRRQPTTSVNEAGVGAQS
jgi:excisionase family DNA binding protein